MSTSPPSAADSSDASWSQLEELVERLHTAARRNFTPRDFFQRLLAEAIEATSAERGAAWSRGRTGRLELIAEHRVARSGDPRSVAERRSAIEGALSGTGHSDLREPYDSVTESIVCPIGDVAVGEGIPAMAIGAIEIDYAAGASSELWQGRRDLLTTLATIAADFLAISELRERRVTAELQHQEVDLLRRVQQPRDLAATAFAVANEARRLLPSDRVALLIRRGGAWRLACASGVSQIDRHSEYARLSQQLAEDVANWGEPIGCGGRQEAIAELPPRLATTLEAYLDHSQARQLAAVPLTLAAHDQEAAVDDERRHRHSASRRVDAVLIAERFDGAVDDGWQRKLVEIGELCAPALDRAIRLDQFPVRTALRWTDRLVAWRRPLQRRRAALILGGVAAVAVALAFVPARLTIEAPATLVASVEREVFASATGSIEEIRVVHGDVVKQGETLIVLSDPELSLKLEQVDGEVDATTRRLDALAISRTDRALRDRETADHMPLGAEQRQLEERLASLIAQQKLLRERHDALTLRSPIDGEVLTADVGSLLSSRPVERGQSLLTIADSTAGWELKADVTQRGVGVVDDAMRAAAAAEPPTPVEATFRLSGDVATTYPAHVVAINVAAPLVADGLEDAALPVSVRLAVDGEAPAAARPGMSASVRIDCGSRSLGYVWFHDAWATIYRWLTF